MSVIAKKISLSIFTTVALLLLISAAIVMAAQYDRSVGDDLDLWLEEYVQPVGAELDADLSSEPSVTTRPAADIATSSAVLHGELDIGPEDEVLVFFFWGETEEGLLNETPTSTMNDSGPFDRKIIDLQPDTEYEFRAAARWNGEEKVGAILTFTTDKIIPTVTTQPASDITAFDATLNMDFTLGGYDSIEARFQWRKAGESWTTTTWQTYFDNGSHFEFISGLESNTGYEFYGQLRYNQTVIDGNILPFDTLPEIIAVSGLVYEDEETNPVNSGLIVSLSVNGNTATTTETDENGRYAFTNIIASESDKISVYLSGNNKATAVLKTDGEDIENLDLYFERLILRTQIGEITNVELESAHNGSSHILYLISSNNLIVSSTAKLLIWQNSVFSPGGEVVTAESASSTLPAGDLEIKTGAELKMAENTLRTGGNFLNSGTFSKSSGQLTVFNAATEGHIIDIGASNFENIRFENNGSWSFEAATTTIEGYLRIIDNATLSGGNDIVVRGGTIDCASGPSCGVVNLSSGTVFLENTGDLGTSGLAADWIFNNLALGDSTAVATTTSRFANSSSLVISGHLTIQENHAFIGPQNGVDFAIKGNYTNNGLFVHNNGRVEFSGTSEQTISGNLTDSSAFNILTFTNNSGSDEPFEPGIVLTATTTGATSTIVTPSVRVQFQAGSTFYFNNINWNGQATTSRVFLRSSNPGQHWRLTINSNPVYYVNVQDSDASGSANPVDATDASNFDAGNNENWNFYTDYLPRSQNWRFFADEKNETPAYALADENQTPSYLLPDKTIKLRLTINEIAGVEGENIKMRIQYATSSDFSENVNFLPEIGDCTSADAWCYGSAAGEDNQLLASTTLSDAEVAATHNQSGISTSSYTHLASTTAEWEFTLYNNSTEEGVVYYFRAYDNTNNQAVEKNEAYSYPSIIPGAADLSFAVEGLPAGTSTRGVITTVNSSPVSVPFNNLPFGQSQIGAHRFNLSTNAPQGYQLFVFQTQDLMAASGEIILPLGCTNESPCAWDVGENPSGYGYHAGDDALCEGTSGRFAAEDSYARFETVPREIGCHPLPTSQDSIIFDFIFRIEATEMQSAGQYINEVVYLVMPTF